MNDIAETLQQRGSKYGRFDDQGRIEQAIKRAMHDSPNWTTLPDDSKSAIEMIATKLSRILKGDPEYDDNWRDIAGYAQLIVDRINGTGIYAVYVLESDTISNGKCVECFALVGDVHAPDCPQRSAVSPSW